MDTGRQPATRAPHIADAGISMVDVLVTLAVLSVVMSVFTTGILQVYRAINAAESATTTQTQLNLAFQRLDKEIRYASWIAEPGLRSEAWYVEFATADGCNQLRLDKRGTLQLLSWTPGALPTAGAAGRTVASQLVYDATRTPFVRQVAGSRPFATSAASPNPNAVGTDFVPDFYRLQVRLTARVTGSTGEVDTTFTALNTTRSTPMANTCSEGRP